MVSNRTKKKRQEIKLNKYEKGSIKHTFSSASKEKKKLYRTISIITFSIIGLAVTIIGYSYFVVK